MLKKQLLTWNQEIKELERKGSVLVMFNKGRIRDFYSENKIHIEAMEKDVDKLRKYFWTHTDGKLDKVDGKPVFKIGRTEEEFNHQWAILMNQEAGAKFQIKGLTVVTEEEEQDVDKLLAETPKREAKKMFSWLRFGKKN